MAGQIPQSFIDDLRERVSIVDVISTRVKLKKAGTSYKACCPFHNEKTPSFNVNAQKNFYHCFGCGASGDSIEFLKEHDNLSFVESVEELAKIAGVEVPRDERLKRVYDENRRYYEALEFADNRFQAALKSHEQKAQAEAYIHKRGLSEEVMSRFGIGLAPAERSFLSDGAKPDLVKHLIELKLVSAKYERPFDLFQNRLMFPIRNMRGKTVGFGGRTLGDDKAKYINSPESRIFHKSNEIYGLYEASRALRNIERLLVVEGYMDVVSLAQHGIAYAVATLGTATNEENLTQLLKRCEQLVFCFDGDQAGMRAAQKAMENLLPMYRDGMHFSFLILPEGEDPDTLVRQEGAQKFEQRVDRALPLSEFFFHVHGENLDLSLPEDRGVLRSRAKAILDTLPQSALKSGLWERLTELTSRRSFKQNAQPTINREPREVRVHRTKDTAICLGLYYAPDRVKELNELSFVYEREQTVLFVEYLQEKKLTTQADLLYALATDRSGYRERLFDLFAGIENMPDPDIAIQELDDVIQRTRQQKEAQKKLDDQLREAKLKLSPDQMTSSERS